MSESSTVSGGDAAASRLRERLDDLGWYHTQELAPGVVTPGMFDLRPYVDRYGIPGDLSGMRALDVGTFEGFWAFELERRGAQVTALDVDSIQQLDWPPRLRPDADGRRGEGFELARDALGSSVERVGCSIYEPTPERLGGQFDLVFCGSVLIHLRDPMLALERMAALCRGRLILADEYSRRLALLPWAAAEFRGETPWSTWWRPAPRAWLAMVRCAGFEDVRQARALRDALSRGPQVGAARRRPRLGAVSAAAERSAAIAHELAYVRGPALASALRKAWVRLRNPRCEIRFGRGSYLGPGFTFRAAEGGATLIVGEAVEFRRDVRIELGAGARLEIGDHTHFTYGVVVQCGSTIEIGERCLFAHGVTIVDGNHRFRDPDAPNPRPGL